MAQQTNFVQENVVRFQSAADKARERIDEEVQRVQKEIKSRRKRVGKQIEARRKRIETRALKGLHTLQTLALANPRVRELIELQARAIEQVGERRDALLGLLNIATRKDLEQLQRKLKRVNRRLREFERGGSAEAEVESKAS